MVADSNVMNTLSVRFKFVFRNSSITSTCLEKLAINLVKIHLSTCGIERNELSVWQISVAEDHLIVKTLQSQKIILHFSSLT